tara:strand:- start:912 stop:2216 length:1305 start_codon:yes stop_codon:yes gene_type:complete
MESIVAKRELGEGRWDKALKRKMTLLSVADNYEDAKHEWIATGEVWWSGNDEMPEWVSNSEMGAGKCLCGHIVVYHFQIENTENGRIECVGSDHINTYLIMRAIAEELDMSIHTITDEQIQQWIDTRTKSMKAEAWWKSNGTGFEMMFDGVKEIDLRYNVHYGDSVFISKYNWNEPSRKLRKRAEGKFGDSNYKMASVVWRWNHPDNPKAQINTTGYPNDNLMKDLSLLYITGAPLHGKLADEKIVKEKRIEELAEIVRAREERERIRRNEQILRQAERQRIHDLPENVEKRRLEAVAQETARLARNRQREQERIEREERQRLQRMVKTAEDERTLEATNEEFVNLCEYYDIPVFDETFAGNDWEREFLASIKTQLLKDKPMSDRQLQQLKRIMEQEPPTERQLSYLRALGFDGVVRTKRQASNQIRELKEMIE